MNRDEVLLTAMRERRSIRRFRDEPVPEEALAKLIEAAGWAPSAGNRQNWQFLVVTSAAVKEKMATAVRKRWAAMVAANRSLGFIEEVERYAASFGDFAQAPAVIVVTAACVSGVENHLLDADASAAVGSVASAAMAAQNLMLAAHALGLGSCCMTGALAARGELGDILGLGRRQEMVCLIAVGLPAEAPPAPARKPITEVARFIR